MSLVSFGFWVVELDKSAMPSVLRSVANYSPRLLYVWSRYTRWIMPPVNATFFTR